MKKIQVFGPGCAKCEDMAALVKETLAELNQPVPVEKVTDAMQFAVAGVIVTPALAIDGKIVVSGRVPSKEELKGILKDELGTTEQQTTGQPSGETSEPCCCSCAPTPCCGGAGNTGKPGSSFRKVVVWLVLALILLAAVKMINRKTKEPGDAPAEAATEQTVPLEKNRLELVYYQYGARCATCTRMENWAKQTLEEQYPEQIKTGSIVWKTQPADKETVEHYSLTNKTLILKHINDNKETEWSNLERIWELSGDEQAYKTYVADSIRQQLTKN